MSSQETTDKFSQSRNQEFSVAKSGLRLAWLPLVVGAVVMILALALRQAAIQENREQVNALIESQLHHIKSDIALELDTRILALIRKARRMEIRKSSIQEWQDDATLYVRHYSGYESIQWFDSSLKLKSFVVSPHRTPPPQPAIIAGSADMPLLAKALSTHMPVLSAIDPLPGNVSSVKVFIPLFRGSTSDGFLVGVFNLHDMMDQNLIVQHYREGIVTVISDGRNSVKFPEVSERINNRGHDGLTRDVTLYETSWNVQAIPTEGFLKKNDSPLPTLILYGGILLSLGVTGIMFLSRKSFLLAQQFEAANVRLAEEVVERKNYADNLDRMNRLYSFLSLTNEIIPAVHNREELFDAVNRVAVEEGKFMMSWIGVVDADSLFVRPASRFGGDSSYFENLRISVSNNEPDGQGPIGIAIRKRIPYVCNDIENDSSCSSWRDKSMAMGFRSLAAFPFKTGDAYGFGTLTLCSGTPGYFRADEIALIERILRNVSFAIDAMIQEEERRKSEEDRKKLMTVIEHSTNVVVITNPLGNIEYVNPVFQEITGWSRDEVMGKNPSLLASGETPPEEYAAMWETIRSGKTWQGRMKNRKKDGQPYWCNISITPIKDSEGDIIQYLGIQEDLTEKLMREEWLQHISHYDALTGLMNRSRFTDSLKEWIFNNRRDNATGVLLLINMDELKMVNDTYGHTAGDEMLLDMSSRIKELVASSEKKGAFAGRIGGDEFAMFIPSADTERGMEIGEQLRNRGTIEGAADAGGIRQTVSISIVCFPDHGQTTKDLLSRADAAMARAKKMGKNRCHVYRPEDRDLEDMQAAFKEKAVIQKALKEDKFLPWFQPILNLENNRVCHYEALARMFDSDGQVVYPGRFVDTAERFGLIGDIDRVITKKTIQLQAELKKRGEKISFGMNLSGKDLGDDKLLEFLHISIDESGADPEHLIFEITETAAIRDLEQAVRFIDALKSLGCKISLDDFGVGFTSFTYLREMQVDFIKIDGSFIRRLHESNEDRHIVRSMVGMARGLGIKSVAEFIENEEALTIVRELGVDYAQGYLIGKPSPELLPRPVDSLT